MWRWFILLPAVLTITGCSTTGKKVMSDDFSEFLKSPQTLNANGHKELLNEFVNGRESFSEQDKINFLLHCVRVSKATFVRNGIEYNSTMAMQWLRWKMMHPQYKNNPIDTAQEFVDKVCLRSNKTGILYEIVLESGTRTRFQYVMAEELNALEKALQEKALKSATAQKTIEPVEKKRDDLAVAPLLPAVN